MIGELDQNLARGTWAVTTEHGTCAFFDFDDWIFFRQPSPRAGNERNRTPSDGAWTRLGYGPYQWQQGKGPCTGAIKIGEQICYGLGQGDRLISTRVISIVPVSDVEAPPPNLPECGYEPVGAWPKRPERPEHLMDVWRIWTTWDLDVPTVEGPTWEAVVASFATSVDDWLSERHAQGHDSRTLRVWVSRFDANQSTESWLREHLTRPAVR